MKHKIRIQSTCLLSLGLIFVILNLACPVSNFSDSDAVVSYELAEESGEMDEDEKVEEKDFISMKLPRFRMANLKLNTAIIEDEYKEQHTLSTPTPPPERLNV